MCIAIYGAICHLIIFLNKQIASEQKRQELGTGMGNGDQYQADGTKDITAVMETWRINKGGKANMLLQYDRAKRKQ